MKHITRAIFILVGLIISPQTFGQAISIGADSVFQSQEYYPDDFNEIEVSTLVTNNTNNTLELEWSKSELQLPQNWETLVCDNVTCHDASVYSAEFELAPGEEMPLITYFRNKNPNDTAVLEVRIQSRLGSGAAIDTTIEFVGVSGDMAASSNFEPKPQTDISFYPNPVRKRLYIQFPQPGKHQVAVFNALGKMVQQKRTHGQQQIALDMHDYPQGMYFIKYQTESGITETKTFTKE